MSRGVTWGGGLWSPWEEMFLCPQVCALQWGEALTGQIAKLCLWKETWWCCCTETVWEGWAQL